MSAPEYPEVKLRPKANARAIRRGNPWVYADELVTDRRTKALKPGSFARLIDGERRFVALVTVNPESKIIARVMDRAREAVIGADWIAKRIGHAQDLRAKLFDAPFYRLVHAEADGLPGLIIDRFGDLAVVQPNAAWSDVHIDDIAAALQSVCGVKTLVKNSGGRTRALEGLDDASSVLVGQVNGPVPVPMNRATYLADVQTGQKTGLFFDQRPNHAFLANCAKGADVLDVFSHVGGFGLAALANGAQSAICVDGSEAALALAEKGGLETGVSERLQTRRGDAFDVLDSLKSEGAKFDVVVCDPPAFAPNKSALESGMRAYERVARMATPLVKPGGLLMLCSCSHAVDLVRFRGACTRGIGRAGGQATLIYTGFAGPDHPQLPQLPESGYLKSLAFMVR